MADGKITIDIDVDGKQVKVASKELDKLEQAGKESSKGLSDAERSMDSLSDKSARASKNVKNASDNLDKTGNNSKKASIGIKEIAVSLGLVAIASAAFNTLKSSLDGAIKRFDTLNSFPKVLQALGVSAEDAEKATSKLSDGIDGLPTTLDEIASNAQRMYTSFNDMDKATDSAIALNNAMLGSGSSAADAQRGTEQYIKALQTGKIQMDTWNTLSETMDVGLIKIAEGFGFAGKSAKDDLYKALQDGSVTLDEFNDKLIEVGTGTGIMAELAKENSLGIATSIGNLKNAAARGLADIIASFDKLSKEVTGKDIAQNIDSLKVVVNSSFKIIGRAIEGAIPIVTGFVDAVKFISPAVKPLIPILAGLATAFAIHSTVNLATTAIKAKTVALKANKTVVIVATAAQNAYALATNRLALSMTLAVAKTKIIGIALAAYNKILALAVSVQALLTAGMNLTTIATIGLSGAITVLDKAIKILMGPVGWVTLAIGALAGAVVGIVKWFKRGTEEGKKMTEETESLNNATNELIDSVNGSAEAYKKSQNETKATAKANSDLAAKVEDLTNKENKSAAEKKMLASYVDQLNGSIEGLNLSYNEEADALNMSSEQLQARIDLMEKQTSYNEALERQVEISKEQREIELQIDEVIAKREEWNQKLEDGIVKSSEAKGEIEELTEKEQQLKETNAELSEQYALTEQQMTESMAAITEATQNGIANQIIAFEDLSESQQATVESMKATWEDYYDAATDMFNRLSDEATVTVEEMQANLEENQRIIGEWAQGIATLAERGVDEGLLETLRAAGPESAGHVNALVNASDEELERLSSTFADGGKTATDALSKSLGIEESGVMEAVGHLVEGTETSLKQAVDAAGFDSIGGDVAQGLSDGITDGVPKVEKSSENMALDATKAAKKALDSHSPSRVFKQIGTDVTDGLALGINDGTNKVQQAIVKMLQAVMQDSKTNFDNITKSHDEAVKKIEESMKKLPKITQEIMKLMLNELRNGTSPQIQVMNKLSLDLLKPFRNSNSQFRSIGTNAMAGLNAGLNAGAGQVMTTARRIANNVAATMRSALRIHSPSRLFRDDIGKMIPAGIAVGIEDNAKSVYNALQTLTSGMMVKGTPEMALGGNVAMMSGSIGLNSSTQVIKEITNHTKGSGSITVELVTKINGKEVAREIVDDVTDLQNAKKYGNRKARRKG